MKLRIPDEPDCERVVSLTNGDEYIRGDGGGWFCGGEVYTWKEVMCRGEEVMCEA